MHALSRTTHTAPLRNAAGLLGAYLVGVWPADALVVTSASTEDIARLNDALGDTDAAGLPTVLAAVRQHPDTHPALARHIDTITADAARVRHETQHHRNTQTPEQRPRKRSS